MLTEYIEKIKGILLKSKELDYAFIFGSVLKRALSKKSDIDILIGAHLNSFEKIDLAMELELALKRKVDVVLVKETSCELVLNAFSVGVPVLINNKQILKRDYFKNFYLYDDGTGLRKLRASRIKRRYNHGQ